MGLGLSAIHNGMYQKRCTKKVMNGPVLLEILISRRNIPPGIGVAGAAG
jgi:hypothetical protein